MAAETLVSPNVDLLAVVVAVNLAGEIGDVVRGGRGIGVLATVQRVARSKPSRFKLVDAAHSEAAAAKAVALIREGKGELLMKGSLHTDELMRAVTSGATGLRTARRISHVFVMDVPTYPKPCLSPMRPSISRRISTSSATSCRTRSISTRSRSRRAAGCAAFGGRDRHLKDPLHHRCGRACARWPTAARSLVACSTARWPSTMRSTRRRPRIKGIRSEVAGRAQILVVPDLEAGNMLAKNLIFLAKADGAGIVLGARVPIILNSRAEVGAQPDGVLRDRRALCPRAAPRDGLGSAGGLRPAINGYDPGRQRGLVERQVPGLRDRRGRSQAPDQRPDGRHRNAPRLRASDAERTRHRSIAPALGGGRRRSRRPAARGGLAAAGARHQAGSRSGTASSTAGPDYNRPILIDRDVLDRLDRYTAGAAPPAEQSGSDPVAASSSFPQLPQVACFDTAFHRGHSAVADHYAIPERFYAEGVRRYGFHGLSYEYIASRLPQVAPEIASGRVIVAHLGSGASMCALSGGRSVESTLGFTALDGLPMGTRPGQLDPGVVLYLLQEKGMTRRAGAELFYQECGLKGLSGISNDMRELRASADPRAGVRDRVFRLPRRAVCRNAGGCPRWARCLRLHGRNRRELGADVRERIAQKLAWLGARLDPIANASASCSISHKDSRSRALRGADRRGAHDRPPHIGADAGIARIPGRRGVGMKGICGLTGRI